jgi:hypothetical protein
MMWVVSVLDFALRGAAEGDTDYFPPADPGDVSENGGGIEFRLQIGAQLQ